MTYLRAYDLNADGKKQLLVDYGSPDEEKPTVFERVLEYSTRDLGCTWLAAEEEYICKDYRSEFSRLYSKVFERFPSSSVRLHFFTGKRPEGELRSAAFEAGDYGGFCVVRPLAIGKVGRTVLKSAPRDHERYFPVCSATFVAHIGGHKLAVTGSPFISQDSMLMCCSHAAIWVCARYMNAAFGFPEVLPHEISEAASKTFMTGERAVPTEGLSGFDIFNCFANLGYSPVMISKPRKDIYQDEKELEEALKTWNPVRAIYRYVESGLPVVVLVPGHAIVAIGHTFYPARWKGPLKCKMKDTASITYSDEWVDGFIVQDDTGCPYTILPREQSDASRFQKEVPYLLPPERQRYRIAENDIHGYIVPLPEKIYISAEHIDNIIEGIFTTKGDTSIRFFFDTLAKSQAKNPMAQKFISSLSDDSDPLVLRVYVSESTKYKAALRKLAPSQISATLTEKLTALPMPRYIWVVEITTAANMANPVQSQRKVLGQIIIDATGNKFAMPLVAAHLPGNLYVRDMDKHVLLGPTAIDDDVEQPLVTRKSMLVPES